MTEPVADKPQIPREYGNRPSAWTGRTSSANS
jgi:hypothetical protein